jgi:glycerophosphoryl diester phosphodiesterase
VSAALALAFGMLAASQVEIVAHRGASAEAPENTLPAFKLGWELGDADELDVYLSSDGVPVVMHDASTKRTAGLDKPIVEQTLAELKALDAGGWKGPTWAGTRIPTLAEAVALVPEGKRLFIEIKCGAEVIPPLVKIVQESGKTPKQLALIAFNHETLRQAKLKLPDVPAYWLVGYQEDKKTGKFPAIDDIVAKAKAGGLDGLDLSSKFPIDEAFVAKIHAAGLKLYTWTVNEPEVALKEKAAGVDGITTDKPRELRKALEAGK